MSHGDDDDFGWTVHSQGEPGTDSDGDEHPIVSDLVESGRPFVCERHVRIWFVTSRDLTTMGMT